MQLKLEHFRMGPRGEYERTGYTAHDVFAEHVEHPVRPGFRATPADAMIRGAL